MPDSGNLGVRISILSISPEHSWCSVDADTMIPDSPLFPERVVYSAQGGQHGLASYQSFCGPQWCTVRSVFHMHFKCPIDGCRVEVRRHKDTGGQAFNGPWWKIQMQSPMVGAGLIRARRWFRRNLFAQVQASLALLIALLSSLV